MSVHRLPDRNLVDLLPPAEVLDALDRDALVSVAARAAALHAGAMARLVVLGGSREATAGPADEHLTAEQVAQLLNSESSWVYRHARPLGGVKLDGLLRFSRRRLEAYIARQHRLGG